MKALQLVKYGAIKDSLAIHEVSKPTAQANDVLIEVKAAAINPIDKGIILGNLKGMLPLALPCTLGYDVSGVVVGKGEEVTHFELGDEVYARVPQEQMGTLAEFVVANADAVSKKPRTLSFLEAAGLPLVGLTAMQCLERVGIKAHDKVLIHAGSGGVGSFAIQYAKAKGAYVYTTTSTENVGWVATLGADRVIDYKKEDYKTLVKDADIVFDTLGKNYTLEAFQVIKPGGKVVSIAGPMDVATAKQFGMADYELPSELAALISAKGATYTYLFMHPDGAQLGVIASLVDSKKIKPVVDTVYPFTKSVDAYIHLASGRAKGKIVINMG